MITGTLCCKCINKLETIDRRQNPLRYPTTVWPARVVLYKKKQEWPPRKLIRSVLQLLALCHPSFVPTCLAEKHLHLALHHVHHARPLVMARI